MTKKTLIRGGSAAAALLVLLCALPAVAQPTEEEILQAVDDGVAWLAGAQDPNGSWGDNVGRTGLACKKLMHYAVDPDRGLGLPTPFHPDNPYLANLEGCLEWLLAEGAQVPIAPQPAGDPDTDGDGVGISFSGLMYENGIMLMLLCEAVELDRVVGLGPLTGLTYEQVAEDLADYIYFCQNEAGNWRGGWRYVCNQNSSDNSVTGWITVGLGFAEAPSPVGCGFDVPAFVKSELEMWVSYVQGATGCSGYDAPLGIDSNFLRTGNLLEQFAFLGDTSATPRVQAAVGCMCRLFDNLSQDPGWRGSAVDPSSSYQANFTATKGFLAYGDDLKLICDPEIDWCAEFDAEIVAEQNGDGSWSGCAWGDSVLCTAWALLTLERAVPPPPVTDYPFDIKPTSCPNPFNCKSKGLVPAAILGTEELDVTQIDPATILLEGVAPVRWDYEDVATPYEPFLGKEDCLDCTTEGPDGYLDLTLKFDTQALLAALGDPADGECIVVSFEGALREEFGGGAITGEDVIRFQCKGK